MATRWPLTNADQVRAYVAATGADCPTCGYCLVGTKGEVCPECGKQLTVSVLMRRPWYRSPWLGVGYLRGGKGGWTALRVLFGVNVVVALGILASALAMGGRMPVLSWLAPGVLGAFAFTVQYIAVFAKYNPIRHDPVERWGDGTAALVLVVQVAGLVLMWV
ncbi:MAG: hypothetical protein KF678_04115 [Phycisphaeraceae bacterium]|nr:hypothetical protein [Phycisphaeraceae bacterium]